MNWYRVTIDGVSGQVLSCEQCSVDEATDHKHVYVLQAPDEREASLQAFKMYLASQRVSRRVRRTRYKAEGKCVDCGEPPEVAPDGKKLSHC